MTRRDTMHTGIDISGNSPSDYEKFKEVGAKVKVKWTMEEIGDFGWRTGWYVATIQSYDDETDRKGRQTNK